MLVLFSLLTMAVLAVGVYGAGDPTAPSSLTEGTTHGFDPTNYAAQSTTALAGNITGLTFTAISQTRAWQGYFGNITGTITLDDANNFTFYNWSSTEPRGTIFASLQSIGTPSWDNVQCFDHSGNGTNFQTTYNISQDAADNVTITYNLTNHPTFYIGDNAIQNCPTTYIWQNDAYQSQNYANMLLWDSTNGNNGWIFTTIIENDEVSNTTDPLCYDGVACDFQILVAEDGHGTDVATTTYNFWVDITA